MKQIDLWESLGNQCLLGKKNINPPYQTLAPQFVSVGLQSLHLDLAAFALGASCR